MRNRHHNIGTGLNTTLVFNQYMPCSGPSGIEDQKDIANEGPSLLKLPCQPLEKAIGSSHVNQQNITVAVEDPDFKSPWPKVVPA